MAVPELSIVVVAHDEEDNVVPLIEENDPADLVEMLSEALLETDADLIQADRSGCRANWLPRRWASWVGRS